MGKPVEVGAADEGGKHVGQENNKSDDEERDGSPEGGVQAALEASNEGGRRGKDWGGGKRDWDRESGVESGGRGRVRRERWGRVVRGIRGGGGGLRLALMEEQVLKSNRFRWRDSGLEGPAGKRSVGRRGSTRTRGLGTRRWGRRVLSRGDERRRGGRIRKG